MTKNSGDWDGLQGHDDDPAQFKHKAWVHEGGGGSIMIYRLVYIHLKNMKKMMMMRRTMTILTMMMVMMMIMIMMMPEMLLLLQ